MSQTTGTLLIPYDIGARWESRQVDELAQKLQLRLGQPVAVCAADDRAPSIIAEIEKLVNAGRQRLVVLPFSLLDLPTRGTVPLALASARRQWPFLSFFHASPIAWLEWSGWLRLTALESMNALAITPDESALLIVGEENPNPLLNADLARLAHLVQEGGAVACARHAFLSGLRPGMSEVCRGLVHEGVRNVIVVPWLIDNRKTLRRLENEIEQARHSFALSMTLTTPTLSHPGLINILVSNHCAALADNEFQSPTDNKGDLTSASGDRSAESTITPDEALALEEYERRINSLLPPEYQGQLENVNPQSMGTAPLKFDSDGKVAWGEIWTSFCDLALAGGPPHRGTLLEAVTAAEALAEPEQYQAVIAEIERGIGLATALPVVSSGTPGWVGVRCESEEMAIWLMRAIIVENIMVRRERDVIYLPAGPRFTLKREIKNVVTAVAKTVHYWSAHLVARRQSRDGYS